MLRTLLGTAGSRSRRSGGNVRLSLRIEDFPSELRVMRDLVGTYTAGPTESTVARRKYGCLFSDETVAAQRRTLERANRSLQRDLGRLQRSGLTVTGSGSFDETTLF